MAIIPIKEISPDVKSGSIRVKVYKVWGSRTYSIDDYISSLEAILVDEEGNAVQASMRPKDASYFASVLRVGKVYDISGFHVQRSPLRDVAVQHAYMLRFTRKVSINEFNEDISNFQPPKFNSPDCRELRRRGNGISSHREIIAGEVKPSVTCSKPPAARVIEQERKAMAQVEKMDPKAESSYATISTSASREAITLGSSTSISLELQDERIDSFPLDPEIQTTRSFHTATLTTDQSSLIQLERPNKRQKLSDDRSGDQAQFKMEHKS